jgi:Tfp pilus assembly protein PilF
MLEKNPTDTFLLYGIAMEHKKAGDAARAVEYFDRVIALEPGYCYAYHQRGLVHEMTGDAEAAKRSYREGIEAARRTGDAHAEVEIQAALDMAG